MKKIATLMILCGGLMLVGCTKSGPATPPAVGTAPTTVAPAATTSAPVAGEATTTTEGSVPVVKEGPQPIAEQPAVQTQSAID